MKNYTAEDLKRFEKDENGWLLCPAGDYTGIKSFPEGCRFGADCSFGEWCRFGAGCSFGKWCSFGASCGFGEGCSFEGGHIAAPGYPMLTFGGFGAANRTTYAFNCQDGIWVRCGCLSGTLGEFRKKVRERHGDTPFAIEYLAVADLIERRFSRGREVRLG